MGNKKIILWEYQKKRVCEFYGCSDEQGKQYPECEGTIGHYQLCKLHGLHRLINKLNEPCEHPKTVCINEEGAAGVFCSDCHEQLEKEC